MHRTSHSYILSAQCCNQVQNYALKTPKAVKHEGGIFLKKFPGLIYTKNDEEYEKNSCETIGCRHFLSIYKNQCHGREGFAWPKVYVIHCLRTDGGQPKQDGQTRDSQSKLTEPQAWWELYPDHPQILEPKGRSTYARRAQYW